jgi:hypothetical protein
MLHPFLFKPAGQRWLATASRLGVLPVGPLYRATH